MNKWKTIDDNYLQYGLKIFPVVKNGKTPLIGEWNKSCSSQYLQVLYWYETAKDCNWGLPCKENNLFVLDLDRHDPQKDGVANFDRLINDLNFTDNEIDEFSWLEQETPSHGRHIIFSSDNDLKDVPSAPNAFKDYPGIDIRNSSYIVVQPSQINGNKYVFNTVPSKPEPMPQKLKEFILKNAGTKTEHKKTPYEKPTEVYKGDRDNQLFQYITHLYYKTRLDEEEIEVLARHFNESFDEPLSEKEVKYKIKKAFQKERPECILVNTSGI